MNELQRHLEERFACGHVPANIGARILHHRTIIMRGLTRDEAVQKAIAKVDALRVAMKDRRAPLYWRLVPIIEENARFELSTREWLAKTRFALDCLDLDELRRCADVPFDLD